MSEQCHTPHRNETASTSPTHNLICGSKEPPSHVNLLPASETVEDTNINLRNVKQETGNEKKG